MNEWTGVETEGRLGGQQKENSILRAPWCLGQHLARPGTAAQDARLLVKKKKKTGKKCFLFSSVVSLWHCQSVLSPPFNVMLPGGWGQGRAQAVQTLRGAQHLPCDLAGRVHVSGVRKWLFKNPSWEGRRSEPRPQASGTMQNCPIGSHLPNTDSEIKFLQISRQWLQREAPGAEPLLRLWSHA